MMSETGAVVVRVFMTRLVICWIVRGTSMVDRSRRGILYGFIVLQSRRVSQGSCIDLGEDLFE